MHCEWSGVEWSGWLEKRRGSGRSGGGGGGGKKPSGDGNSLARKRGRCWERARIEEGLVNEAVIDNDDDRKWYRTHASAAKLRSGPVRYTFDPRLDTQTSLAACPASGLRPSARQAELESGTVQHTVTWPEQAGNRVGSGCAWQFAAAVSRTAGIGTNGQQFDNLIRPRSSARWSSFSRHIVIYHISYIIYCISYTIYILSYFGHSASTVRILRSPRLRRPTLVHCFVRRGTVPSISRTRSSAQALTYIPSQRSRSRSRSRNLVP